MSSITVCQTNKKGRSRQRGQHKYLGIIDSGVRFWGVGPPCCIARTCLLAILHELRFKHRELPVHSKSERVLAYWEQSPLGLRSLVGVSEASIELDGLS